MEATFITMKDTELEAYRIINRLIEKQINGTIAAKLLGLSVRQTKRLKARVLKEGAQGILHRNRGKESNRKIKSAILEKAKKILKENYSDFGPTFATEKLEEIHKIKMSVESMRTIMTGEKLWKPKTRRENGEYRTWRPRMECYGEMQQFDGSYHKWFEDRGGELCLLASIDDATGKITRAVFEDNEGVHAVFRFWKSYVEKLGKPLAVYLDRYSTYKVNHKSATDNHELLTQFQRASKELGIRLISAYSPQAKGRIERLFGTLQDRLVKELRLRGISDIETANKFLEEVFIPEFNAKFAVVPTKADDLHRPLSESEKSIIPSIFSIRSERKVNNDFTIQFKNQWYQLEKVQPITVLRKDTVTVEERQGGTIHLGMRNKTLAYCVTAVRPEKEKTTVTALVPRTKVAPPASHPWRTKKTFVDFGKKNEKIAIFAPKHYTTLLQVNQV
jgi:hypothetical protein